MEPGGVNDVMHRMRARRIFEIWKNSVSWVFASEEEGTINQPLRSGRIWHKVNF